MTLPVSVTFERYWEHEAENPVVARFATIKEAEDWISDGAANNFLSPADVEAGLYGINAPEEMINP